MGKIMFLEDQPDFNFIINVFGKLLSDEEKASLLESENDPNEISSILRNNLVFELVTDFSKALKKLEKNMHNYDLLIVDRDLYDNGLKYNPKELPKTEPSFSSEYHKREGDFLIGYCKMKNFDIDNRFYIFTGNTDDLRLSNDLKLILTDKFKSDNIIIKGSDGKNKLIDIIDEIEDLQLVLENKFYCKILKQLPIEKGDFQKLFLNIIKTKENTDNIKDNLNNIRNILEAILIKTAKILKPAENGNLHCSYFISNVLSNNTNTILKYRSNTSSTIIYSMKSIYKISSQFGAHSSHGYQPTINTINFLLFALKDIILWYGKEIEKNGDINK